MRLEIKNLIEKYQVLNFLIAFLGRGMGGALNLIFIIFAAKLLGSEKFGLFALSITVMQIALQFAGQGLDTVLVRFYVYQVQEKTDKETLVLKTCLYLRIFLTILIVGFGILLSELYVNYFNRPDLRMPLIFGFIGCGFASFWYYSLAVLQAKEDYVKYSFLSSGANVFKMLILSILFILHQYSLFNLLSINMASFLLGVFVAYYFIPWKIIKESGDVKDVKGEAGYIFSYGKWIILSSLISIFYSRIDILILSSFRSIAEVGYYSAAITLINCFDLIIIALFTVFLPNASKIRSYVDTINYVKFSSTICLGVLSVLFVIYMFSDFLILSVLGQEYVNSIKVFKIVFFGFLLYLFIFPWALIIYSYNKPHLLFMSDLIVSLINLVGGLIFIPTHGMLGASWINLLTRVLNSAIIIYLVATEAKRMKFGDGLVESPVVVKEI